MKVPCLFTSIELCNQEGKERGEPGLLQLIDECCRYIVRQPVQQGIVLFEAVISCYLQS